MLTLVTGGNALSGSILDDSYLGEASLVGEVSGRSISFTKTYLITSRHSVYYTGKISEEGNKMQGKWKIGFFSGRWEALRNDDNLSFSKTTRKEDRKPVLL